MLINKNRFPKRLGNRVGDNFFNPKKMNNLELNKFGVQELNKDEMMNVEGGAITTVNGLIEWTYEGVKRGFKWFKELF